jgi:TonB family protein
MSAMIFTIALAAAQGAPEPLDAQRVPAPYNPHRATPKNNPGSWVSTNDYPVRAIREERQGRTGFSVTVDANGFVTSCRITETSGHADLDDATCVNVTKRALFNPAVDAQGRAVASTYTTGVMWKIPEDYQDDYREAAVENRGAFPRPPATLGYAEWPENEDYPVAARSPRIQGETTVELVIDELGKTTSCTIINSSGTQVLDDASCPYIAQNWKFTPALDFDGNPTKGRLKRMVGWYYYDPDDAENYDPAESTPSPRIEKNLFVDPGSLTVQFDLDTKGRAQNCVSNLQGLGAIATEMKRNYSNICDVFTEGDDPVKFEPFVDASGKAVQKTVRVEVVMTHPTASTSAPK